MSAILAGFVLVMWAKKAEEKQETRKKNSQTFSEHSSEIQENGNVEMETELGTETRAALDGAESDVWADHVSADDMEALLDEDLDDVFL